MHIATKLRITTAITIAAFVVLISGFVEIYVRSVEAKLNCALDDEIRANSSARAFVRDQYFINHEDIVLSQWDKIKKDSDALLARAKLQFTDNANQQIIDGLIESVEDVSLIFHRLIFNHKEMERTGILCGTRNELDKQLSSQLLVKEVSIRDNIIQLRDKHSEYSQQKHQQLSMISLAISVLAGLVVLLISVWMTRFLARPLQAITASFMALASGNLAQPIPGRNRYDEIGALASAAEVFKDKARQLDEASRYKTEFLANMSHELRTPLNSMLILSKILAENATGNLTTEQTESASIVYEGGTSLLSIINDILELSKIEAGQIDIHYETKTFRRFTEQFSRQFRHVAAQKGIEFQIKLDPGLPEAIHTDWGKITQIVRNLVGNAMKFTERGSVHLWICRSSLLPVTNIALPSSKEWLVFQIRDTGIGIDADKHEHIFEAFRQADGSTNRKYGGTGLGLAISRRYAILLGGMLNLESTLGMGSTFRFFLPMSHVQMTEPKRDIGDGSNNNNTSYFDSYFSRRNITCIAVDDDANNLYALRQILGHRVHRLWTASDGQQALNLLEENPDTNLILLDIMMPVLNGYETMRAIRAQSRFDALRIIALTARALPEDRERCMSYGANHYLAKPLVPAHLLSAIIDCLGNDTQNATIDPSSANTAPPRVEPSGAAHDPDPTPLLDPMGLPINILIIDPNMRTLYSLAQAMKPFVQRCLLAAHCKKAMELLGQCEMGAIVLDPQALSIDGQACLAALRSNPRASHLPIIILSATDAPEETQEYRQAGASGYVSKSATPSSEEHMERSVVRRAPRSREGRTFCRCPQPYRGLRQNVRQPSTA